MRPQAQYFTVAQESQTGWDCAIQVILIEETLLCNEEDRKHNFFEPPPAPDNMDKDHSIDDNLLQRSFSSMRMT
jgi:hypothetical protein